jgi:hypothetical protein
MIKHKPLRILTIFCIFSTPLFAQKGKVEGEVKNEEVVVEKSRKIEMPQATRIFDKVASPKYDNSKRSFEYQFVERKLQIGSSKFAPQLSPYESVAKKDEPAYENFVRAGAGNYGRLYGEFFLHKTNDEGTMLGITGRHNSSSLGPVDGENSANGEQYVKLFGKYLTNTFKLDAALDYNRQNYHFYGYRKFPNVAVIADSIRQTLNKYGFEFGAENTDKAAIIDFGIRSRVSYLTDRYDASELDWSSKFHASLGITDNFVSLLNGEAYISQRVDGPFKQKNNRNVFKIKPTFVYKNKSLNVMAGLNVAVESDNAHGLNRTKGFPVVQVDFVPIGGIHVFAGIDGDIQRNTLGTFLKENQWLAPQVNLLNTEKSQEYYIGTKGGLMGGFSYEAKVSLGKYRNFYAINNSPADTSKFIVQYDTLNTVNVTTFTGQINYQMQDFWRSFLKLDYYIYGMKDGMLPTAWHRPNLIANWSNSIIFKKKLIISTDFYLLTGISGKNFVSDSEVKLPAIIDLNSKFTYQLSDRISAFVSLNNILGQNNQRYLYYKQQGLNFLVGVSFSF